MHYVFLQFLLMCNIYIECEPKAIFPTPFPKAASKAPVAPPRARAERHAVKSWPTQPLDEPLLRRDLEDRVELEPGGCQLLLCGPVVALTLPLPSCHHKEDEETHHDNEGHASNDRPYDQGQFFG